MVAVYIGIDRKLINICTFDLFQGHRRPYPLSLITLQRWVVINYCIHCSTHFQGTPCSSVHPISWPSDTVLGRKINQSKHQHVLGNLTLSIRLPRGRHCSIIILLLLLYRFAFNAIYEHDLNLSFMCSTYTYVEWQPSGPWILPHFEFKVDTHHILSSADHLIVDHQSVRPCMYVGG